MGTLGVRKKLEGLRMLETELLAEHSELQEYNRETFGERDFDPEETTIHSRAADAIGQVVNALEEILGQAEEADLYAGATGQFGGNGMVPTDDIWSTLDEHLPDGEQ